MPAAQTTRLSQRAPELVRCCVWSIALIALVPGVAIPVFDLQRQLWARGTGIAVLDHDESALNGLVAVLSLAAAILIWRMFIVWTFGRKALTALVSVVPFVQVVIMQPLWNSGCGGDTVLELSQQEWSMGLWLWGCVWVWWGVESGAAQAARTWRGSRMTTNGKHVLLSLGSIPFTVGTFGILWQAWDDFSSLDNGWQGAAVFLSTALIAIPLWMVIWRTRVAWSPRVMGQTLLLAAGIILLTIGPMPYLWGNGGWFDDSCLCFPIMGWGVWMGATIALWPMKPTPEQLSPARPACLECGYELTGLTHTRCPECGSEPTLDELWSVSMHPQL